MQCSRCTTTRQYLRLASVLALLGGHSPTEVHNIPRRSLPVASVHPKLRGHARYSQPRIAGRNVRKDNWGQGPQPRIQDQSSQIQFNSIHSHNPSYHPIKYASLVYDNEWFNESIGGLSCQHGTQQLCDNEDDCVQQIMKGHSDSVRTLTWYCQSRDATECTNSTDYGGKCNVCGGFGYQFQGIAITWVLGMLTGRVMLLKWEDESVINKYLSPHMIDWKYRDYVLKGSNIDVGSYERVRVPTGHARARAKIEYNNDLLKALTSNITHVRMHLNLLKLINEFILSKQFKMPCGQIPGIKLPPTGQFDLGLTKFVAIHTIFKFSDQLKSYLYNIQSQITNVTLGEKYVAVHLRTGVFDDLQESSAKYRLAHTEEDWTKAIDCARMQADEHIGPDSTILLVSDSGKTKHLISKEYPRVKIFENKIIHVDKHANVTEEGMLGIWQDIAILAQSYVLLEHRSTFSDLAAILCGIPPSKRINFVKC